MTTREIQGHLEEIYGVEMSPSLISGRCPEFCVSAEFRLSSTSRSDPRRRGRKPIAVASYYKRFSTTPQPARASHSWIVAQGVP